jgi:Mg-chelatase subunit ChlD
MQRSVLFGSLLSMLIATAEGATDASLTAPATAPANSSVSVRWSGPGAVHDFISIDPAGARDTQYGPYAYPSSGNPVVIEAPDQHGHYVIRYHLADGYAVIATTPLDVTDVMAKVEVAPTVAAGGDVTVKWSGPNEATDFVSIDAKGAPDETYGPYVYAKQGSPAKLKAPDEPGEYLVRYHVGATGYRVIGSAPLTIGGVESTLQAPDAIGAGGQLEVHWTGPGNPNDFISIDAVDAAERTYGNYAYPKDGNPVSIRVPDTAGNYQVRYHAGQSYGVLAARPIRVDPATATLTPPAQIVAGTVFDVAWRGPNNEGDFVTLVEPGAADRQYGPSNGYTRRGNPVRLEAPREPGRYQLRYLTGQTNATLASADVTVSPGAARGKLRVVSDTASSTYGAVEFVLDASGSMLQRLGGERRIDIAKRALVGLADAIPSGSGFALRVFGDKEANACRSDLEISQPKIDKAAATAKIKTITAMNLAKTPIAASLAKVPEDLRGASGTLLVILMTDGEETCGGQPKAAIEALHAAGLDVRVNIVGFAIDEVALKETFTEWARVGKGTFFDAQNAAQLEGAVRATLNPTYDVLAKDGTVVASGSVNGDPIELPVATYAVRLSKSRPLGDVTVDPDATKEVKY